MVLFAQYTHIPLRSEGGGDEAMKAYLEPDEVTLMEKAATNLRDRLLIHLGGKLA